jgi:hypothetical protein
MADVFDAFLSYHSSDRAVVLQIAKILRVAKIRIWIDQDELRPGLPWQTGLQEAIRASATAVIFFGPHDFGDWQRPEISALLHRMVKKGIPVIPVLLPGAPKEPDLGVFLEQNTWVDLRSGLGEEGINRLIWGINGRRPAESSPETSSKALKRPWRQLFSARGMIVLAGLLFCWLALSQSGKQAKEFLRRMALAASHRTDLRIGEVQSERLDALINGIGDTLYDRYDQMLTPGVQMNAWEGAQVVVALNGLKLPNRSPINPEKVLAFFSKTKNKSCHCWEVNPWESAPKVHIGSTAWVVFAKAQLGIPAEPDELRFLLANQIREEGAWSMFPCQEAQSGSTYATSWATLALGQQVDRGLVQEPLLTEVRRAVRAGVIWIYRTRLKDGLWKSYPLLPWSDQASISNSGLAIHALHRLQPDSFQQIDPEFDRQWISRLSPLPEPAYLYETFNGRVCKTENPQDETVRYLVLPWKLVATVEAYPRGNISERETAIRLIESVASNKDILGETKYEYWVQAELLIALRYVRSRYLVN